MKIYLILTICLFAAVLVNAMDENEAKDMFRSMSQDCKEQEKADDADVETMVNKKYPETREGKCMVACMLEQFMIVKDGKFSKEGYMAAVSMAAGDDEKKLKAADEMGDECAPVSDPDRCEQAIKIGKCMQQGAEKRNFSAE